MLSNTWGAVAPALAPGDVRYRELVFCRFRYAVAALALVMAAGRRPFSPGMALLLLVLPVAIDAGIRLALRRMDSPAAGRRLGHWVLATDTALALTVYLVFLPDPGAIPASFVPLVVFELAVRFEGRAGLAAGLALFAAAIGVRVFYQLRVIPGGALRWPLLLVWVLLAALIAVLARELQAQSRMRQAAQRDRERVADSFQLVVGEMLARSGIAPDEATWEDVLTAVRSLCDREPAECATLAAGIAELLLPASRLSGLTRREREIVRLLALGYPYERIARALFVSGSTVRNHVHNIKSKLGLSSREEVIAFACQQGLAAPGPGAVAPADPRADQGRWQAVHPPAGNVG